MLVYLARRLLLTVPLLILVSIIAFTLINVLPGDVTSAILGAEASAADREALRQKLGLDRPLPLQYLSWFGNFVTGDFGTSLVDGTPVAKVIAQRLPATLELLLLTTLVSALVGIPLGVLAAVRRASLVDYGASTLALAWLSVPHFWLGMMLLLYFSVKLRWLPASGYVPFSVDPKANMLAMIMPGVATGLREAGIFARFARSSLLEVLRSDYVRTARAKGLAERRVIYRHAIRNAMIPVLTAGGLQVASLIGGLVITESIFVIPGFGRLILDAIMTRDMPVLQGSIMVVALLVAVVNLGLDVLYTWIDPRIKLAGGESA